MYQCCSVYMGFIRKSSARMKKTEHIELYIWTYGVEQQYNDMMVKANLFGITDSFIEHSNVYVKYCDLNNANHNKLYLQGYDMMLPELYNLLLEPCYLHMYHSSCYSHYWQHSEKLTNSFCYSLILLSKWYITFKSIK